MAAPDLLFRLWIFLIQAFFVAMLVLPTTLQVPRGAMLVVLAMGAVVIAFTHWRVHREILMLWVATMAVGAFGITWGSINAAPGALRVTTVYLIWPTLYLLFIGLAHDLPVIRRLESALLLGIGLATAMALSVLSAQLLGIGDVVFWLFSLQGAGFGNYEGFTEFRLFNLTTVMYGFPFVVALLLSRRAELRGWPLLGLWLLLAAMLVVALGSGRRMFWLLVMITPFLALFFLQLSARRLRAVPLFAFGIRAATIAALSLGGIIIALGLQPNTLAQKFIGAFLGQEASSGIRFEQAQALWRAFESSPLIGIGLGSSVDSAYRQGWAFELWYLSLLKSVGLVGFLVFSAAIGWIVLKGMALARRDREFAALFVPLATAMAGFLIMTATNPYLGKFDYLWVIFLPVALINAYLTQRPKHD